MNITEPKSLRRSDVPDARDRENSTDKTAGRKPNLPVQSEIPAPSQGHVLSEVDEIEREENEGGPAL